MKDNKNKLKMVLLIGAFFLCGVLYFSLNAGSKKEAVVNLILSMLWKKQAALPKKQINFLLI